MLIDVAHADGFAASEIETIEMLARRRGIRDREIQRARRNAGKGNKLAVPAEHTERMSDMVDLVRVMVADGKISPAERDTARSMARRYGLREQVIDEILIAALDSANRGVAPAVKKQRVEALQNRSRPGGGERDAQNAFIQMLVAMAGVDGVDKAEITMIAAIAVRRGIPQERFSEALRAMKNGDAKVIVPSDPRERYENLFDLVCVLLSDGKVTPSELQMARTVAGAYDIALQTVDDLVMRILNEFNGLEDNTEAADSEAIDDFLKSMSA